MATFLANYRLVYVGYSTARDYTRCYEQYRSLLGVKGGLKDVQRPWAFEAVREYILKEAKTIAMEDGSCEFASCFMKVTR
jgi:hypothetical protein